MSRALLLSTLLLAACSKAPAPKRGLDAKVRLQFITAHLEMGDWAEAAAHAARLAREQKGIADVTALTASVRAIGDECRRRPDPASWDYTLVVREWTKIAESPAAPPALKKLAARRVSALESERDALAITAAALRETRPLAAMRLRAGLVEHHARSLVFSRESARFDAIRARFETALRDDVKRQLAQAEPDWDAMSATLDEASTLLGSEAGFRELRDACRAGLDDRRVMELAIELCDAGEWARASESVRKLSPKSHYEASARTIGRWAALQQRLREAVEVYRAGDTAGALKRLSELRDEWPAGLKNGDLLDVLAREIPVIAADIEEGDRRRVVGEYRLAIDAYRRALDNRVCDGRHRRDAEERLATCRVELVRSVERLSADFAVAVDAGTWGRAHDAYRALDELEPAGEAVAQARARLAPKAAAILDQMQRNCWNGTFGANDRAAAKLLDAALVRPTDALTRLDGIRKSYPRHFAEAKP
jgi:hypothetical protein